MNMNINLRNMIIIFIAYYFVASAFANTGKDIFERFCIACHSPSMAPMFGSPAVHDISAWQDRKDSILEKAGITGLSGNQKEEASIKELVKSAVNGTDKGMPPMGTCNDCTEDDLALVIKYMSSAE